MRPIWKGHLTFGLVTIPVKLYNATDSKDIRFRLLHNSCLTPIQNKRFCPHHNEIVEWGDVVRGFEYAKGKFVTLTEEELEHVPLETAGTVSIVAFVSPDEINPIYFEKSYYLAPDEGGAKAFRLLNEVMAEAQKVAVGKVVIKEKEHLVAVRPHDAALVMSTLFYAGEVRAAGEIPDLPVETKIHPNEKKMAMQLIEGLAGEFKPEEFQDEYRDALQKVIQAKVEGAAVAAAPARQEEKVVDLMDALRRSLQMARSKEKQPARKTRAGATPQRAVAAMRERHR